MDPWPRFQAHADRFHRGVGVLSLESRRFHDSRVAPIQQFDDRLRRPEEYMIVAVVGAIIPDLSVWMEV